MGGMPSGSGVGLALLLAAWWDGTLMKLPGRGLSSSSPGGAASRGPPRPTSAGADASAFSPDVSRELPLAEGLPW
eukprot:CAMPEP_0182899298 /NCGR_PEP_ID=MMETSP0034_2-20130328/28000_1 /TAXON_ID=156128 /ORGANISM="Nephroselmis pyriformis, Strain CCMP717" /LENGTH=74 /DNA_ID=CAMNT_0025033319 /DNA_START=1 /DNA_END=222 /DNA_ORIENTATION=+